MEEEKEESDNQIELFTITTKIVGKRYYAGVLNNLEMVRLVREPNNPYDSNAIKVINIDGHQVGHISAKCGTAACLARIVDRVLEGNFGADLEAVVLSGVSNVYSTTCQVKIIGYLEHHKVNSDHIKGCRIPATDLLAPVTTISSSSYQAIERSPPRYERISEKEVIKKLDTLWDNIDSELSKMSFKASNFSSFMNCFSSVLFEHQEKGVAFMLNCENRDDKYLPAFYEKKGENNFYHSLTRHNYSTKPNAVRGGLIGDDMGLGKSIQTLATILCNPPKDIKYSPVEIRGIAEFDEEFEENNNLDSLPKSVIYSWETQIRTHLKLGSLKYCLYHGPNRSELASDLMKYDVVISTYDVLSSEFDPKGEEKKKIEKKKRKFDSDDEEYEEEKKSKKRKRKAGSPIFNNIWYRVVLDEGHIIRNMKTNRSQACIALRSNFRWVLSGTPIQNQVVDLHSLLHFLQISPFKDDSELFNRFIGRKIKVGDKETVTILRTLIKSIAIRRKKDEILELNLPIKESSIISVKLSKEEREAYDAINKIVRDFVIEAQAQKEVDPNFSRSLLGLITRLRQCCLDMSMVPPSLIVNLIMSSSKKDSTLAKLTPDEVNTLVSKLEVLLKAASSNTTDSSLIDINCAICFNVLEENSSSIFSNCKHIFCSSCIDTMFEKSPSFPCPMCRASITRETTLKYTDLKSHAEKKDGKVEEKEEFTKTRSSKTLAILDCLSATRRKGLGEKTVIFSSFTKYLDILADCLVNDNINFARIDGSLTQVKRKNEQIKFDNDPNCLVLLCSLKACGVGLNLTSANHVYLSDLWWNPSVDEQAIDRVYRLGQRKNVSVYRFIVENSIEGRIYSLQKEKAALAKAAFEREEGDKAKKKKNSDLISLVVA